MARIKAEAAFGKQRHELNRGDWMIADSGHEHIFCSNMWGRFSVRLGDGVVFASMPTFTSYSTDQGKTWLPIDGEPRGIKPGDVIVNSAGNPLAYVRGDNSRWPVLVNVPDQMWHCSPLPCSIESHPFGANLRECWILDGADADAVLPQIIRGEKVTVKL